jgi:hypothetical protein
MLQTRTLAILLFALVACSGAGSAEPEPTGPSETERGDAPQQSSADNAASASRDELAASADGPGLTPAEVAPLGSAQENFVVFAEPGTGFSTREVYDADREVVRFDSTIGAMVSAASGDAVGGWNVTGSELRWTRSGVAFQVRFGSEAGERRAYFTEAARGTICNLRLSGPENLSISGTNETPPGE